MLKGLVLGSYSLAVEGSGLGQASSLGPIALPLKVQAMDRPRPWVL